MINNTRVDGRSLFIERFVQHLVQNYEHMYGKRFPKDELAGRRGEVIETVATSASELIAVQADTLYHNLEHTVDVTLTMQEILLGKSTFTTIKPEEWVNCTLAAIYHDIGYVPTLFEGDNPNIVGSKLAGEHVERSKRYVIERFDKSDIIDGKVLAEYIDLTSVPIKNKEDTTSNAALLRAADYIGQLANINIRRRNQALLYEFQDSGFAADRGFSSLIDVVKDVPDFFENQVLPIIKPALNYLSRTIAGQRKVNELYGVIKQCELAAKA